MDWNNPLTESRHDGSDAGYEPHERHVALRGKLFLASLQCHESKGLFRQQLSGGLSPLGFGTDGTRYWRNQAI